MNKVVALAMNYKCLVGYQEHYEEPIVFLKSREAIIGHGETIFIPPNAVVWPEVELAIIIGKRTRSVLPKDAHRFIAAYAIANDVTASYGDGRDVHFAKSKCPDTFLPMSHITVAEDAPVWKSQELCTFINEHRVQASNIENMIFGVEEALAFISSWMTLNEGDIILTGTPWHNRPALNDGDIVSVYIEGLGELINKVAVRKD